MNDSNSWHIIKYLFLILISTVFGQNIPLNTWRIHNSFYQAQAVEVVDTKVYCGTSGGLFYYDTEDNSLNKITTMDGLSETNCTALKYDIPSKILIIGYSNGAIDLLINEREIVQISNLKNSLKIGSKKVNDIIINDKTAFLCTDLGVIALNLDKKEIKESYLSIGPKASDIQAFQASICNDSLFIATSKGLLAASVNNNNLMDFKNWKQIILSDTLKAEGVNSVGTFKNKIFAGVNGKGIFSNINGKYQNIFVDKRPSNKIVATSKSIYTLTEYVYFDLMNLPSYQGGMHNVSSLVEGKNGINWASDKRFGLFKIENNTPISIIPNGPFSYDIFNIRSFENELYVVSGGFAVVNAPFGNNKGYYTFINGAWNNYLPGTNYQWYIRDITDVQLNPSNNTLYFSLQGQGLMKYNRTLDSYDYVVNESTGCSFYNENIGEENRLSALEFDDKNNEIWVTRSIPNLKVIGNNIFKIKADNTCQGYTINTPYANYITKFIIDNSGNKWAIPNIYMPTELPSTGVIVFNENIENSSNIITLYPGKGLGNLPSNSIRCIAKDRKGDIWIGTSNGVAVYSNPSSQFISKPYDASIPIFGSYPLFFEQVVNDISIDGGNRKWFATGNGLYLMNEDATQVIHYFNTDNSPLKSNNITKVHVLQNTGEVFIATETGLYSYREPATKPNPDKPSEIIVFPNPVKTSFNGLVGIANLAEKSVVKIVDITGTLVYQTRSNGGTAAWNGKDYNGNKIQAGVYTILAGKEEGDATVAGKIFVVD
ncbi:MAG: two-component regulator propeller domain-containing protein [Bacteroidota bacterium]|nr:two-component regulator propeller domain-containing protein [Bacteroidota bacterium]